MISKLRGRPADLEPGRLTLMVGSVGYELSIPLSVYAALEAGGNEETTLHVHTHVREDALQLYGFLDASEREAFRALISISGVGPKLALTLLSGMDPAAIGEAIEAADRARLEKIPGIGRKTAERLLLELRDRWPAGGGDPAGPTAPAGPAGSGDARRADAVSALANLGYPEKTARRAVDAVAVERPAAPLAEWIRLSLARLL